MKNFTYIFIIVFLLPISINAQSQWYKYPGSPVLFGDDGDWDADIAFGKVILDEGIYKMWYTGGTSTIHNLQIGYATSPDGINWKRFVFDNPVLRPGSSGFFDAGAVGTPTVIKDGNIFKMWYAASTTNPPDKLRIGYATSSDGINWTRENNGNPVLNLGTSGEWDDFWVTQPTVIKEGSIYKMWYCGSRFPIGTERIGYATSPDGINWTKYNDPSTASGPYAESDPVLEVTPGEWDNFLVYHPCVILNNSTFEMWYTASGTGYPGENIGHATSTDGINWMKDTLNPVLEIDNGFGSFDNLYVFSPSVMLGNDQIYRMWYSGYGGEPNKRRIGYATTDPAISVDNQYYIIPESFSLSQNYPNPFNPSTTISWQSPVSSHQTLRVYDLLGREVAALVDEFKPAGSYNVEFNASSLSSGTYFYRLQTGEYVKTKKLILMK